MGSNGFKKLFSRHTNHLKRVVTIDELHEVIFNNDRIKAPGPDKFNFKFYKKTWGLLKVDLFMLVLEFFCTCTLPKRLNTSYIMLVSKIVNCRSFSDYRPISLINRIYKMILNTCE